MFGMVFPGLGEALGELVAELLQDAHDLAALRGVLGALATFVVGCCYHACVLVYDCVDV